MKRYKKSKGKAIAIFFAVLLGALATLYVGLSLGSGSWNPAEWVPEQQVEEQLPEETPGDSTEENQ